MMGQYMTAGEAEATHVEPTRFPGTGAYTGAVLFPLLGVVFAAIAFGKGKVGPGFALLLTAGLASFGWSLLLIAIAAGA